MGPVVRPVWRLAASGSVCYGSVGLIRDGKGRLEVVKGRLMSVGVC